MCWLETTKDGKIMNRLMLTKESFDAARGCIEASARPLEKARFRHAFENGPMEAVFNALSEFRNPGNGFGRALEPDFRAGESSALCTSMALRIIRSTDSKPRPDIVSKTITYLVDTLDRRKWAWRIIPESAGSAPHAPWFDQANLEKTFSAFSLNPTAEILGFLYDYQERVPKNVISGISDSLISHVSNLEKMEMHDLLCCIQLLQADRLPKAFRDDMFRKLLPVVKQTVTHDAAQWKKYNLRPLQVADSPESPFLPGLEDSVSANLDYEISSQNPDGSWAPTWSWGGSFPDDWPLACREWTGILTLDKLLLLRRFKRIEGR